MDQTTDAAKSDTPPTPTVSFSEAVRFWTKLGFISFGGPAGQIGIMQTELVDRLRWIGQAEFLRGLNFAMLLPGPEAQQLAAYLGWRMHGLRGAIYAGLAFIVPGMILILGLAWVAATHGENKYVAAMFFGIKPIVVAIVLHALWRLGSRTLRSPMTFGLAAAAFVALHYFGVPFPLVVLSAGVFGALFPALMPPHSAHGSPAADANGTARPQPPAGGSMRRFIKITAVFLVLWIVPVAAILVTLGLSPWAGIVQLFTTAAFVTFGGAYAVLPYIANAAVETHGWLTPAQMIDGLALAESTPGPLILVTVYVGYFAGLVGSGVLSPLAAGLIGGLLTAYVTFLPCFWFILAAAPFVDRIQEQPKAHAALSAITAAVVGVVLNLAVFFGEAVFLEKDAGGGVTGVDPLSIGLALFALLALVKFKVTVPPLIAAGAVFGLTYVSFV
jgi:chromate transporter